MYLQGTTASKVENSRDISRVRLAALEMTPTLNIVVAPSPSVVMYGEPINPTTTSV